MNSRNPALQATTFEPRRVSGEQMTLQGVVNKTALLLTLMLASAAFTWREFYSAQDGLDAVLTYLWAGALGALVIALVTVFVKRISPFTAPVYAVLEGLALGALTAAADAKFPGIALQASGLAVCILVAMLIAYRTGLVKVSEKFKLGVAAATGGICLLYLVDLAMMFMGKPVAFIHEGGFWGISFSLFVVLIASLNLVVDFDYIEGGVADGMAKFMEWYSAFALLVTLVWLYLEVLRLFGKSRR